MKYCTKCYKELNIEKFSKSNSFKDGYNCWCKECNKEYKKQYNKIPENKKHILEKVNKWNNDNKERSKEIKRESARRRYKENPDKFKQKTLKWNIEHKILSKFTQYQSGAKTRGYLFELTLEQFTEIVKQPCHYCGKEGLNGIDRKDNTKGYLIDNCLPCCNHCNIAKRSRTYSEYITWIKQSYAHLTSH